MAIDLKLPLESDFRRSAVWGTPRAPYVEMEDVDYDGSKALLIGKSEWQVVSPTDVHCIVGTDTPVTDGIAVAAHNYYSKATGLVHLRPDSAKYASYERQREETLRAMLRAVRGQTREDIDVRIVGPHKNGENEKAFLDYILDELTRVKAYVLSVDSIGKPGLMRFAVHSNAWEKGLIKLDSNAEISRSASVRDADFKAIDNIY